MKRDSENSGQGGQGSLDEEGAKEILKEHMQLERN